MYHKPYQLRKQDEANELAQLRSTNKALKIALAILAVLFVILGINFYFAKLELRARRMAAYAEEHNCTWVDSEYIDRDPVCK